jgi:hypothetical protein
VLSENNHPVSNDAGHALHAEKNFLQAKLTHWLDTPNPLISFVRIVFVLVMEHKILSQSNNMGSVDWSSIEADANAKLEYLPIIRIGMWERRIRGMT